MLLGQSGFASITLVQHTITPSGTCSSTSNTCTIAVSSTGANHAGVLLAENATGSSVTITSVSGGGTWTRPAACHLFSAASGSINCAYTLSTTASATSITLTWSSATPGFSRISFYEYSSTTTSIIIDAGATAINAGSNATSTTPIGVSLTLTGANDVIVQGIATQGATVSSVAAPYSGFLASSTQFGSSNNLNTASSSPPTWTLSTTNVTLVNGIALTEVPQFTLTVTVAGLGTVTDNFAKISCPGTCSASYTSGSVVILAANPSAGNSFTGWSGTGGCTGTSTCSLTMNAAKAATATFTNLPSSTVLYQGTSFSGGSIR